MSPKARSIITDITLSLLIFGAHLGLLYLSGPKASYVGTAILAFWVGYLRPSTDKARMFPQWLLINFWFFIYIFSLGREDMSGLSLMFLLASYVSSGLGFLTHYLTSQSLRGVSLGIALALTLLLAGLAWLPMVEAQLGTPLP